MQSQRVDIEVYVQTADRNAVVALLRPELGELELEHVPELDLHIYSNQTLHLSISESVDGFLSVWLRARGRAPWHDSGTPWPNSPALARFLVRGMGCMVRCDPEDDYPEVPSLSDVFLQIDADGRETLFTWGD
ncbi:hypothetical protein [Diaphorobacter caeni]|uniref:hypothetical protein n=1 Tax=Diaphorobacter caeni TaxID=2784387 RepID=UPI00188F05BD|nr:hypothetical protein [Diaphorobacter caeni]MBF5004323.1 hypothetical protein [Diaphorobacter caeni]